MSSARPLSRGDELKQTVYTSDAYTAVKHAVYKRYTQCWMGKILRSFPQGAAIVDAFSGAGEYSDGLEGSPIVFAQTFLEHTFLERFNKLDIFCLDERADRLAHLAGLASKLPPNPRLQVRPLQAGRVEDRITELSAAGHAGSAGRPVLWILDPYGWADVPIDLALRCLNSGPRDEVIISLFTEEMYRFWQDITKQPALTRVIGEHWREAVQLGDQRASKDGLAEAYCQSLRDAGFHVGRFAVAARERMPRYHLIYATHSEQALRECWNSTTWYLDHFAGNAAGAIHVSGQGDLFDLIDEVPETDRLRRRLELHAGEERTFQGLQSEAVAAGFKTTHLRQELTAMRAAGLAVRVDTDRNKSDWPDGCVVRFYSAADND